MAPTYDFGLVALSVLIAILSAYAGLDLASRVKLATGREKFDWLIAGAVVMGLGIWAMHFVGMLAFHLPVPIGIDLPFTLLSILPAIAASGIALYLMQRSNIGFGMLVLGGVLMGGGIGAMHYVGMMAVRMQPPIRYDPTWFVLSVLFAIAASTLALWIGFKQHNSEFAAADTLRKLGSATIMGFAIAGMHYMGMAAARFAPNSICISGYRGPTMEVTYNMGLVALSLAVAVMASYSALDLSSRTVAAKGWVRRNWIIGGALSMGLGIWAMHFVGMLAYRMPTPMGFDLKLTLLSIVPAIAASAFALFIIGRGRVNPRILGGSGLLMGAGIGAMHYTGMAAMKMSPPIHYDPTFFMLSVLFAVGASIIALWIAFKFQTEESTGQLVLRKLGSAVLMGGAIAGMHYMGMAASKISPSGFCLASLGGIDANWLAGSIGAGSLLIFIITYIVAFYDARLAELRAKLISDLTSTNEKLDSRANELALAMTAELRASAAQRRLFATVVDQSTEAIITKDLNGNVSGWNNAAARMLGFSQEEMLGRSIALLQPPGKGLFLDTAKHTRVNPDGPTYLQGQLRTKDGRVLDVSTSVSPLFDENGKLIGDIGIVRDISQQLKAEAALRDLNHKLRELSAHMEQVREDERARIAQSLHDEVGQCVAGMQMALHWLERRHANDSETIEKTTTMRERSTQAFKAMRDIIQSLHPPMLDDLGMSGAAEALVEDFRKLSGLNINLTTDDACEDLPKSHKLALYRALQEALTNVAKHAQATQIEIKLAPEGRSMVLRVQDNGRGMEEGAPNKRGSYGLFGMSERASMLGGKFEVQSAPSRGTSLKLSFTFGARSAMPEAQA